METTKKTKKTSKDNYSKEELNARKSFMLRTITALTVLLIFSILMALLFNDISKIGTSESGKIDINTDLWSIPRQFWGLLWSGILTSIVILFAYHSFRKADPKKPLNTKQTIIESFVNGFYNLTKTITGGRLKPAYPYFFSIFIFLCSGIAVGLMGLEPPQSSIMVTFTLGLITFIGIYVVGITTKGIWKFMKHKYANPLELISQFSPLLSISIRLFGSTFAFAMIMQVPTILVESMGASQIVAYMPLISIVYQWLLRSTDIFLSLIQAFVFTSLTMIYWGMEVEEDYITKSNNKLVKELNRS